MNAAVWWIWGIEKRKGQHRSLDMRGNKMLHSVPAILLLLLQIYAWYKRKKMPSSFIGSWLNYKTRQYSQRPCSNCPCSAPNLLRTLSVLPLTLPLSGLNTLGKDQKMFIQGQRQWCCNPSRRYYCSMHMHWKAFSSANERQEKYYKPCFGNNNLKSEF